MTRKLKAVSAIVMAAGLAVSGMAQVAMQTTQDYAEGNRLVINGKPLFMSGMNIAWSHSNAFGSEVGDASFDLNAFSSHIKNIRKAGGNSVRWWLHTDASNCPKINPATGEVTRIGSKTIENIKAALDVAYENGVVAALCLFSFDLLVPGDGGKGDTYYPDYTLDGNHKFLLDETSTTINSYITKVLNPMLEAVGSHPAIMCWEVFNEPEGMLQAENWSHVMRKITFNDILRVTNQIAGAVHRHPNSRKMVSTGIKDFSYLRAGNSRGVYSTANLIAAGGDEEGYLDFYMAHYYPEWQGTSISPFSNPASHWNSDDKPILIGEFPARDWSANTPGYSQFNGVATTIADAYEYAFDNGYVGAMSWSMTEGETAKLGGYETTAPALQNLFGKHKDAIMIKDVEIEDLTGDLAMKLALNNLPVITEAWSELGTGLSSMNFGGKTNLTFEMYIADGSGTNLDINVVVKTGSNWTWTPGPTLKLDAYEQGEWVTITVPVSSFGSEGMNDVKSLLFQFGATGTPYTGTVFIDNVKLDDTNISDFDDESAWALAMANSEVSSSNAGVSIVTRASAGGSSSVRYGTRAAGKAGRTPIAIVRGKTLSVTGLDNSPMSIKLVNVNGRTVARFNATGRGQFSLAKIPAGRYIVETRVGKKRVGSSAVVVR